MVLTFNGGQEAEKDVSACAPISSNGDAELKREQARGRRRRQYVTR